MTLPKLLLSAGSPSLETDSAYELHQSFLQWQSATRNKESLMARPDLTYSTPHPPS